eukprot:COSAG04_NODE_9965_length_816_cov_1.125523_1_plen_52_part_10
MAACALPRFAVEQNVEALDVAVEDAHIVELLQALRDVLEDRVLGKIDVVARE